METGRVLRFDRIEQELRFALVLAQEAARLRVLSVDYSRRGELALRGVNPGAAALPQPVIPQLPAISNAAPARATTGTSSGTTR